MVPLVSRQKKEEQQYPGACRFRPCGQANNTDVGQSAAQSKGYLKTESRFSGSLHAD